MTQNALEPIVNAIFNYGRWFLSCWIEPKFNFKDFFKVVGLKNKEEQYPKLIKSYTGDLGTVYLLNVPTGLNMGHFESIKDSLEIQIKKSIDIRLRSGFIEIETIEKELSSNIPYKLSKRTVDPGIKIPIGENIKGEQVILDLNNDPMTYIVGTTGSGKSVCTKVLLTSLITTYKSSELEIFLGDLKRVELSLFANVQHCKKFVYTVEDVTDLIADLLAETNERYDLFMQNEVTNIFEYNKLKGVKKLKYQVLYLEEIVMLLEDKNKRAMKILKQLIAISRAAGLYCFYTTQRPDNTVIDNVVKANTNNRICFKTEDTKNSIVALDREGAEKLRGKGHGLIKRGANTEEFQAYFISDTQVKEAIKPYLNKPQNKAIAESNSVQNKRLFDKDIEQPMEENIIDLSFLD